MLHVHDERVVTGGHARGTEQWGQHFLTRHLNIKGTCNSDTSTDGGMPNIWGGIPSGDEGVGSVGEGINGGEGLPARRR